VEHILRKFAADNNTETSVSDEHCIARRCTCGEHHALMLESASMLEVIRMKHRSAWVYGTAVRVTECLKLSERGQIERSREDGARSNNGSHSYRLCTQLFESVLTNFRRRRRGPRTEGKEMLKSIFFLWLAKLANYESYSSI